MTSQAPNRGEEENYSLCFISSLCSIMNNMKGSKTGSQKTIVIFNLVVTMLVRRKPKHLPFFLQAHLPQYDISWLCDWTKNLHALRKYQLRPIPPPSSRVQCYGRALIMPYTNHRTEDYDKIIFVDHAFFFKQTFLSKNKHHTHTRFTVSVGEDQSCRGLHRMPPQQALAALTMRGAENLGSCLLISMIASVPTECHKNKILFRRTTRSLFSPSF